MWAEVEKKLIYPYPESSPALKKIVQNYSIGKDPMTYFAFSKLREYQENPEIVRTFGVRTIVKTKRAIAGTRPIMTSEQKERFEPFYEDLVNEYDLLMRAGYDDLSDEPYKYVRRFEVVKKPCFFRRAINFFIDGSPLTFWESDEVRQVPDLRMVMEEQRKKNLSPVDRL